MSLWNKPGPEEYQKPVSPEDSPKVKARKLDTQIKNGVSERVSLVFLNSVNLNMVEETLRAIYGVLSEKKDYYEEIEALYKKLFEDYVISLELLESLKKYQQKFRSMIDINKFKEECMKDPILESYGWKEFAEKMLDILEKPSASSYDEYFKLRNKKRIEIKKSNEDFYKTEAILSNQYLKWRKEFADWADKVFRVFYNLSSIDPIRTWEEAVDKATKIWMEKIFWDNTTLLPKDEKESKRISELSKEERLWEIMQNSEKIESLKNITQEMKDKVREGIRSYYKSHINGFLEVDYYPKYELLDILMSAWIDRKDISRICPEKTSIKINPVDYSIYIIGNYSSEII